MRYILILATLLFAAASTGLAATNRYLVLDGVNDAVEMPPVHYAANELHTFTICAWGQPLSTSSPSEQVVCERAIEIPTGSPPFKETRVNLRLGVSAQGYPFVQFNGSGQDGVVVKSEASGSALPTNAWTHLAGSYDMSALRLYTNGTVAASTPSTETPFNGHLGAWSNAGVNVIGAHETTPTGIQTNLSLFFSGHVDEVQLWDGALSELEIEPWMHQQPSGVESNLVGFWDFDSGVPTDRSSNDNAGVLVGDATTTPLAGIPPPIISDVTFQPAACVWWSTAPAVLHRVECSTNLLSTNWVSLGPEVLGNGTVTNVCDTNTSTRQKFWRIVSH